MVNAVAAQKSRETLPLNLETIKKGCSTAVVVCTWVALFGAMCYVAFKAFSLLARSTVENPKRNAIIAAVMIGGIAAFRYLPEAVAIIIGNKIFKESHSQGSSF